MERGDGSPQECLKLSSSNSKLKSWKHRVHLAFLAFLAFYLQHLSTIYHIEWGLSAGFSAACVVLECDWDKGLIWRPAFEVHVQVQATMTVGKNGKKQTKNTRQTQEQTVGTAFARCRQPQDDA